MDAIHTALTLNNLTMNLEDAILQLQQNQIQLSQALNKLIQEITEIKRWISETDEIAEVNNAINDYNFVLDNGGFDAFGYPKNTPSEKEQIHMKLTKLEEQLKQAEQEENYKLCQTLADAIAVLRKRFTGL